MKKAILALLVLGSAQSFASTMWPQNLVARAEIIIPANSTSVPVLDMERSDLDVRASCELDYKPAPYARVISSGKKLFVYRDVQIAPTTLDDVKNYFKGMNNFSMPDSVTTVQDAIDYMAKYDGFPNDLLEQSVPRKATIELQEAFVTCVIQKKIQVRGSNDMTINKGDFSDLLLGLMDQGTLIPDPTF